MAIRSVTISMDDNIFDNANVILEDMGLDLQTAIKMFLKKIIRERRMPFELSATQPTLENQYLAPLPTDLIDEINRDAAVSRRVTRPTSKITNDMCQSVWDEFKRRYLSDDRNSQDAAQVISNKTGMNKGSAFIYFTILNNLIDGAQNTRTLKFEDLEFFVEKIRDEFPEHTLKSTIISLKASIPYWDEKVPGSFADKVRKLLERLLDALGKREDTM